MTDNPRNATILSLGRNNAVILAFMDGNLSRHVAWMRQRGLSPNTVDSRVDVITLLLKRVGKPAVEVSADDLTTWQQSLGLLALNSRRTYLSHVRGFYQWLYDSELVDTDPSRVLVTPKVGRPLPRPVPELRLERALGAAPPMIRVWLELAGYEGLRAGEIAGLERADVQDADTTPFLYVRGKGGKHRVVPLSPSVLSSLREYGMPARGRLFRRLNGHPITPRDVSRRANTFLHGIGLPETIHQFRHRFGTKLYQTTRDIRLVQEQMGHADISTTSGYAAVDPSAAAKAVAAIDHPLLRPVQDTAS